MQPLFANQYPLVANVMRSLGFWPTGRERDEDVEQGVVRVVITGVVLLYILAYAVLADTVTTRLQLAVVIATAGFVGGVAILWQLRRDPARTHGMRLLSISADMGLLTIGLWAGDEAGIPLIGVYLWVVVGNGFRFGPRYLLISYWASLACFALLLLIVPFWSSHRAIGAGFLAVLVLIPAYVLTLLRRLMAQKEAAEQLSNAKSRFVANVSHELRTPLAGVYAVYDLMRGADPTPKQQELVESLGEAITSLKVSVDAILQMSKLEAGAERAHPCVFNLREFLRRTSTLAQPQAVAKGLEWKLEVAADLPTLAFGDVGHLQHVLGNLVNNAIKFTASGFVCVRVLLTDRKQVRFEVVDSGIGIALEQQEKLFERFVQADTSATRKFGGTGLGTSIAHDLVELMGGKIGLQSQPGCGSTFWFELPLPEPTAEVVPQEWKASRPIWLIGADNAERWALGSKVRAAGFECTAFAPEEALPSGRPLLALLLTDCESALRVASGLHYLPWFFVADNVPATTTATLVTAGVAGLLPAEIAVPVLRLHGAAVASLPDLGTEDLHAVARSSRPCRILLADDNRSNLMLLSRILRNAGHQVTTAGRGDEAYEHMVAGNIDLAILDLNMPEMTGPQAANLYRVGAAGSLSRLPILILSADATPAAREESLAAGADAYITKPVTAANLLEAVACYSARSMLPVVNDAEEPSLPAPVEAGLLDTERIAALSHIGGGNNEFLAGYVDAAFEDIQAAVAEVQTGFAQQEERTVRDGLHKIDGTAASIGATALLATSKRVRDYLTAAPGDPGLELALAELCGVCTLTKSKLLTLVNEKPSPR